MTRLLALGSPGRVPVAEQRRAIGIEDVVDGGNTYPGSRVEIPGTVCSNGSQYRFWYYDSPTSNNMVISFEGGGACWDYPSCSGQTGILGAANPNGIPTDYITQMKAKFVSPIINGADPGIPLFRVEDQHGHERLGHGVRAVLHGVTCTSATASRPTPTHRPEPAAHVPPQRLQQLRRDREFPAHAVPEHQQAARDRASARAASRRSATFYNVRRTLNPTQGYLLNDSGPALPDAHSSLQLGSCTTIKTRVNLPSVFSQLPASFNQNDFGSMNSMVATQFPNDKMAYTGYSSDYNFSRFSYERFYPGITQAGILTKWRADQTNLINQIKNYANYSYHVPWQRPINDSHCSTIITMIGSHACPTIRKKYWYEVLEWPQTQSWKCPSGFLPFETFLANWINTNSYTSRIVEPSNNYNNEDPGMQIIAPLINDALAGA